MSAAPPFVEPRPGVPAARSHAWRRVVLTGALALVVIALVRSLLLETFYVSSDSMAPSLRPADRVVVWKARAEPARGQLVVFDGSTTLAPRPQGAPADGLVATVLDSVRRAIGVDTRETDYLKRVIGVPGDRVVCCDEQGRLSVNGAVVQEGYLPSGEWASDIEFDVRVPEGRLWVMGDHRSVSRDSRALLGAPGGGAVPVEDVVGVPVLRFWPLRDARPLRPDAELESVGPPSASPAPAHRSARPAPTEG